MRLESVHVRNFRSLRDVTVTFGGMTTLIGPNSTGKTSVLEALRLFGENHVDITEEDFFPGATTIEVNAIICPKGAAGIPKEYLFDGKITAQRVAELATGGNVEVLSRIEKMCINDLVGVRSLRTARERQAEMKRLSARYPGLQHRGSWPDSLNSYERDHLNDPAHKGKYRRHFIDIAQSEFGSGGILDIMYVPAVSDMEADAVDDGASPLSELIDMTVRGSGKYDKRLEAIIGTADKKAGLLMRKADKEGAGLAAKMRKRTRPYADDTEFELKFSIPGLRNARPRATLTLREGGLPVPMGKAGNGIQRISLIALLETIYSMGGRGAKQEGGSGRARVMLIDEPELYQHPQRQGRMLRALGRLAKRPAIQVVCSTHSPYLVWLGDIGHVRRLQKDGMQTTVSRTTIGRIAKSANSDGVRSRQVSTTRMAALLDMASSRWITEGLFARLAVLVEGPGDRNMLLATARAMKISLDELEIAIVPCGDKFSIANVFHVYDHLGVPLYLVWDTDSGNKARNNPLINRGLQRLAEPDTPDDQDPMTPRFGPRYSCPDASLSAATVKQVEGIEGLLAGRMRYYGMNPNRKSEKKTAVHNQRIMYDILKAVKRDEPKFADLPTVKILDRIVKMRAGL